MYSFILAERAVLQFADGPHARGSECDNSAPSMSNNSLVSNPETGQRMKYKQAVKLEAEGSLIWVDPGKTFRNATRDDLPQILAKRAEQAAKAERLAPVELPGITFESPISDTQRREHADILQMTRRVMANPSAKSEPFYAEATQ